ncbi:neuromedin U receptor homolog nmur-2-like [Babylonia areolata]|uniref:neuromedin U receptor homolog nmur-2-like n=1 Tax=Babylonia areolata TaxID=304850 RepID=UPI003FCEF7C0
MTTSLVSGAWNNSMPADTSESPPDEDEKPWWTYSIYTVTDNLWTYYPPIIILFGVFGNVMTIVIMRRIKSDESTINIYFTAIAVTDTMVLIVYTLDMWLYHVFDLNFGITHSAVCKVHTWLYTGGGTISCWYLVCMTVHRAMSVVWPHRVNVLCTRRTVFLVLSAITVFFALLYSHYLIGFEKVYVESYGYDRCTIRHDNDGYMYFFDIFVYIEVFVYSVLPFLFIVASNAVLVWKLTMSVKMAGKQLTQGDSDQVQASRRAANSITLTVAVVSVTYIVLTLPVSVDFVRSFFAVSHGTLTGYEMAYASFVDAVTSLMDHTNPAVNFYLYCLTGRRFREEFLKVVCCGRNRLLRGAQQSKVTDWGCSGEDEGPENTG